MIATPISTFARDVRRGLAKTPQRELSPQYFYDEVGAALFEAITRLPEYGLTRADERLLRVHADEIVARFPSPVVIAELGSGNGKKTRWLIEAVAGRHPVDYYPIDVSRPALEECARALGRLARVTPLEAPYAAGVAEVARRRAAGEHLVVLFLGSTIGNFDRPGCLEFLRQMRERLTAGDAMLIGADLVKPVEVLLEAYDDPAGVTAAFNLNLLARINRELGGNFDLRNFRHEVRWDTVERRIEMHLRSTVEQAVSIPGASLEFTLRAGETIWTESSHKFHAQELHEVARAAGFRCTAQWIDEEWPFAESLFLAAS